MTRHKKNDALWLQVTSRRKACPLLCIPPVVPSTPTYPMMVTMDLERSRTKCQNSPAQAPWRDNIKQDLSALSAINSLCTQLYFQHTRRSSMAVSNYFEKPYLGSTPGFNRMHQLSCTNFTGYAYGADQFLAKFYIIANEFILIKAQSQFATIVFRIFDIKRMKYKPLLSISTNRKTWWLLSNTLSYCVCAKMGRPWLPSNR